MLAQLCRHVVRANHISKLVTAIMHQPNIDVVQYQKLLDMEEEQSRAPSLACRPACDCRSRRSTAPDSTMSSPDQACLLEADLSRASLQGASLFAAQMQRAKLHGAALSGARIAA